MNGESRIRAWRVSRYRAGYLVYQSKRQDVTQNEHPPVFACWFPMETITRSQASPPVGLSDWSKRFAS